MIDLAVLIKDLINLEQVISKAPKKRPRKSTYKALRGTKKLRYTASQKAKKSQKGHKR